MSDRELLTLAAKTAGIELWTRSDPWAPHEQGLLLADGMTLWRPQHDDGDALRLAATCHMVLDWSGSELHVRFWLTQSPEAPTLTFKSSDCGGDKATIVRAAAEIGRTMP